MSELLTHAEVIAKVRVHFTQPGAQLAYADTHGTTYDEPDEGSGVCVYRMDAEASASVRCAFGVLIPDDLYVPAMEGRTAGLLFGGFDTQNPSDPLDNEGWHYDEEEELPEPITVSLGNLFAPEVRPEWLNRLQRAHDETAQAGGSVADFLTKLDEIERHTND